MDDIKATSAKEHEDAAHHLEIAAQMHRDAAKQSSNGNFEKARSLATSAAEADEAADIDTPEQWRRWSGPAVEPVGGTGVSDPSRTVGRSSAGPDHDEERCR